MASKFRVTVSEIPESVPVGADLRPSGEEVFKIVIDSFDPVGFTKAITQQPRRKRRAKQEAAA